MNHLRILAAAVFIFACIPLIADESEWVGEEDGEKAESGSGTGESNEPEDLSPVPLPENLPGGAVKKFHRAASVKEFPYSGFSKIITYLYDEAKTAREDFERFASASKSVYLPVGRGSSELLSDSGALYFDSGRTKSLLFRVEEAVVEITIQNEAVSIKDVVKTAEEILTGENKRIAEMYSTIEKTYMTFISAVEKKDRKAITPCLSSSYLDSHKNYLEKFMDVLETMKGYEERYRMSSEFGQTVKFLRSEEEGAGGWAIIVIESKRYFMRPPWMAALKLTQGMDMQGSVRGGRFYWVPFVKEGNAWKINVNEIKENDFPEHASPDNIAVAINFMRATALLQDEFKTRDLDRDNLADYSSSIEELCNSCLGGVKFAPPAGCGYEFKLVSGKDGGNWSLTASPVNASDVKAKQPDEAEKDGNDAASGNKNDLYFYIDQTGVLRAEKEKPADAASDEYPSVSFGSSGNNDGGRVIYNSNGRRIIVEKIVEKPVIILEEDE
jgi:hypothetical protein